MSADGTVFYCPDGEKPDDAAYEYVIPAQLAVYIHARRKDTADSFFRDLLEELWESLPGALCEGKVHLQIITHGVEVQRWHPVKKDGTRMGTDIGELDDYLPDWVE
jgi:hypothetical protein